MGEASSLEDAPTLFSPAARPGLGSPSPSRQRGGAEHLEAKTSSKPGLRMRRVSPEPEPAELPLPTSASSPAPAPAPARARCYLLRFRGFPPTWADATSSKYRVQSPTDTTASTSSSRKRRRSSLTERRSSRSSAARRLPMAWRPGGRRQPQPPAGPSAPSARGPSPSPASRGRAEAASPGRAPAGRGLLLSAPGVGQLRGRQVSPGAAPPPLVSSAPGSPLHASPVAGALPPSRPTRSLARARCPPGGSLGARQPAPPLSPSRSGFLCGPAAATHPPVPPPPRSRPQGTGGPRPRGALGKGKSPSGFPEATGGVSRGW